MSDKTKTRRKLRRRTRRQARPKDTPTTACFYDKGRRIWPDRITVRIGDKVMSFDEWCAMPKGGSCADVQEPVKCADDCEEVDK